MHNHICGILIILVFQC